MTTDSAPSSSSGTTGRFSPAMKWIAVILVIVLLGGGAFVVYKLTDTKELGTPPFKVAAQVKDAIASGNTATITKLTTAKGRTEASKLTAADVNGMTGLTCAPFSAKPPTRVCTWSRPGGQLSMAVVRIGSDWKVETATVGPAATTPTTPST
ncbi:MAG: hypothetical protein ACXVJ7_02035 [Acidimicrobiia bacterium]